MTVRPDHRPRTPFGAPLVPPLPIRMRRIEILTVVYETDREAADALIPEPLDAGRRPRAALHVYWMHDAEWFGVYGERAVQLPVVLPDGARRHVLAVPRARLGRRRRRRPRALRAAEEARRGGARARRRPAGRRRGAQRHRDRDRDDVLQAGRRPRPDALERAGAGLGAEREPAGAAGGRRAASGASWWRATFEDVDVHEAWTGPATLELRPNAQAPLHLLPVRRGRARAPPAWST